MIDRRGAKDIAILMGDFNAKIGMDNPGYENIMGTHGQGQMNKNGESLADLNQLVIGGSIFPHKRIQKATWISPNQVTDNQIDHIRIGRKFRKSWQDVRVTRGADVSSDYYLLMTTVRLRLKRFTNANSTRTRYNVGLFRNKDTQAAYQTDMIHVNRSLARRRHNTRNGSLPQPSTSWKQGERGKSLNNSRTRVAKVKAQEEYTTADREVKRSI